MTPSSPPILVTGGTGFVGGWTVTELLRRGHAVRTTVRDTAKEPALRAAVTRALGGEDPGGRLTVVAADLLSDAGWDAAVAGVDHVLHVASPLTATKDEESVIRPAVDGVQRVLRASRDAGVTRVVYTSTCGAIYYGHPPQSAPFDETSWTNVEGGNMSAYVKSKALAERAAWDLMAAEGGALELAVVNPSGIFGPALTGAATSSTRAVPDLWFGVVDVRDVVDLHLRAMVAPEAAGERFIATQGPAVSMRAIAAVLRERFPDAKIPARAMPSRLVRLVGRFNTEVGDLVPLLGQRRDATSAKAQRVLGWTPRPWEEAVIASAESLRA
jgi:dihydroflavonol-4-reductase